MMNQHYHPLRDTTTTSPNINDNSSPYYTHHRTGVSLFSPTNMNITPTSSSSPFKPTATLSPYSSPSAIVSLMLFLFIVYLFILESLATTNNTLYGVSLEFN
jgi:hypothetical protein